MKWGLDPGAGRSGRKPFTPDRLPLSAGFWKRLSKPVRVRVPCRKAEDRSWIQGTKGLDDRGCHAILGEGSLPVMFRPTLPIAPLPSGEHPNVDSVILRCGDSRAVEVPCHGNMALTNGWIRGFEPLASPVVHGPWCFAKQPLSPRHLVCVTPSRQASSICAHQPSPSAVTS